MTIEDAYTDSTEVEFISEDMGVEKPTNSQIDEEEQPGSNLDDNTTENTIKRDNEHSVLEYFDMNVGNQGNIAVFSE